MRAADPATRAVAIGACLALLEGLIESAAGPVFESVLFAYGLAIPLGVVLARSAVSLPAASRVPPAPLAT